RPSIFSSTTSFDRSCSQPLSAPCSTRPSGGSRAHLKNARRRSTACRKRLPDRDQESEDRQRQDQRIIFSELCASARPLTVLSPLTPPNLAPAKSAPVTSASVRSASVRSAPVKS